jgi:hypothetical protein
VQINAQVKVPPKDWLASFRRRNLQTPSKICRWQLIYPNSRTRAVKTTQFRLGLVFCTTPLDCRALDTLPELVWTPLHFTIRIFSVLRLLSTLQTA